VHFVGGNFCLKTRKKNQKNQKNQKKSKNRKESLEKQQTAAPLMPTTYFYFVTMPYILYELTFFMK
jgi:hypothetical protein